MKTLVVVMMMAGSMVCFQNAAYADNGAYAASASIVTEKRILADETTPVSLQFEEDDSDFAANLVYEEDDSDFA